LKVCTLVLAKLRNQIETLPAFK